MRRVATLALLVLLVTLALSGCGTLGKERKLHDTWGEENKRQNQALGERVYDKDFDLVFTAIITGLSDLGFSIRNMERQSGYILGIGGQVLLFDIPPSP